MAYMDSGGGVMPQTSALQNVNYMGMSYTAADAPKGSMTYTAANLGLNG